PGREVPGPPGRALRLRRRGPALVPALLHQPLRPQRRAPAGGQRLGGAQLLEDDPALLHAVRRREPGDPPTAPADRRDLGRSLTFRPRPTAPGAAAFDPKGARIPETGRRSATGRRRK